MAGAQQNSRSDEALFESEVLRVARALWAKDAPFQGSVMMDGSERDGVFVGPDVVAVVEATVSRRLDKAVHDGDKLKRAVEKLSKEHKFKAVKGYFVTRDEPEAKQRQYIEKLNANVVILSMAQLRALLIDSREYLHARSTYPFGSARNPVTGGSSDLGEYVPLGLVPVRGSSGGRIVGVSEIVRSILDGEQVVLLGDFGAGKSMTLREVHKRLASAHLADPTRPFPVTLNLRDHQSQKDPDEALRRHANSVGFADATQLVRAWRAGEILLLLDGFDEIATSGWLGQAPSLQNVRHRSVELVRKFIDQAPSTSGVLITGREHLFDSYDEMQRSLGLDNKRINILRTDEFTDGQVSAYLKEMGWEGALPDWLPTRPLLLGYLSASGSMKELVEEEQLSEAAGWDLLLNRICEREAKIELGLDGATVRRVLERLATIARSRGDGFGPIYKDDLARGFRQACGYELAEDSYVIVQRMPGLGVLDPVDGSRNFIDSALGDAARAGDVVRLISNPQLVDNLDMEHLVLAPMGDLGLGVAELMAQESGIDGASAIHSAVQFQRRGGCDAFVLDSLLIALRMGLGSKVPNLTIKDVSVPRLQLSELDLDLSGIHFVTCLFGVLDLTEYEGNFPLPVFSECMFEEVLGASSPEVLPGDAFSSCTYGSFDMSTKTTRGILAMPGLSDRQKVILSILKKVYLQAGGSRRQGAFLRGLDHSQRELVASELNGLVAQRILVHSRSGSNDLYSRVRGHARRVRALFENPVASNDPILVNARD